MFLLKKRNRLGFTPPLLTTKDTLKRQEGAGFMLLEVILSVLLIGCVLAFVIHSYTTSLKASQMARMLGKACLFVEAKIAELDMAGFRDGVKEEETEGSIEGQPDYKWHLSILPLDEEEKISKVNLSVRYKLGSQYRKVGIVTFLKKKEA